MERTNIILETMWFIKNEDSSGLENWLVIQRCRLLRAMKALRDQLSNLYLTDENGTQAKKDDLSKNR
jgi:hypothetical protein